MRRLIGSSSTKNQNTIHDTTAILEKRNDYLSTRIENLEQEIRKYKAQLAEARTPQAKDMIMKRLAILMKQRKGYLAQQDTLTNQQFNLDQLQFTTEQLKISAETVKAMKYAQKELKKQYKSMKIDQIEKLQDSMFEMMADAEELQEVLSRSYDVSDYDDASIMAELEGISNEVESDYLDALDTIDIPTKKAGSEKNDLKELEEELA